MLELVMSILLIFCASVVCIFGSEKNATSCRDPSPGKHSVWGDCVLLEGNILSFHKIKPIHSLVDDAESIRIKSLRGAGCNIRILGLHNRVEQDDWSHFMLEKKSVGSDDESMLMSDRS
mmetsp:Transcript_2724/g.4024  ORF Transcript_2724/g.4024 Transcript_2724/m.4024 type:complete len:119 (+) Transcript_2724:103-459(+)